MEGYIVRITKYDYDKYYGIVAWVKSDGTCDAKLEDKYQKKESKVTLIYNLSFKHVFIKKMPLKWYYICFYAQAVTSYGK